MQNNPYASAPKQARWKPTVLFWIVAAVVLLLIILFAFAGGVGMALFILGLIALLTGLYALLFKRRSWVGLPHRKSGGLVAIAGFVALILGVGVGVATAAPGGNTDKAALVSPVQQSATPTPTPTNPANSVCLTAAETRQYSNQTLICTLGSDQRLLWMLEADSKRVVAEKAAVDKAAADKLLAEAAAVEKAAAEKAAAEKAAADKAVAEKAAAEKAAADQIAAQLAAEQAVAQKDAEQAVKAVPVAPAPPAPAAPNYVTPGAFCSGGAGVSKTGKPMICAPAKDGRMRWQGA